MLLGVSESCRRARCPRSSWSTCAGAPRDYLRRDGLVAEDEYFFAEQNAALIADAEEYYRTMFGDAAASWNLRDRHMADTLDHLMVHLDRHGDTSRVVVWEHNSHIGDARATEMAQRGELNLGQLMRERHARDAVLVGFTTLHRHGHRRLGLGRRRRAQARPAGAARQLRGPVPRGRDPGLPAVPAARPAVAAGAARAPAGACDRA